jgi:hypothetical protein
VHGPVVEQRQDRAADVAAADAVTSSAATAAHLMPPVSVAASLSVHLSFSFRSIMK